MSDEFDKEAEREKLREKYGEDEEDRKATERMSDLLLKGATMTNTHCGTCGDPLFRQNDVTFCPSCHGGPEGVEGTGVEGAESGAGGGNRGQSRGQGRGQPPAGAEGASEPTEIDVSSPEEAGGDVGAAPSESSVRAPSGTDERAPPSPQNRPDTPTPDRNRQADRENARTPPRGGATPDRSDAPETGTHPKAPVDGTEADAHDSLTAALEYFSAEAAATDDPRYATECLEAAREAAEALEALR